MSGVAKRGVHLGPVAHHRAIITELPEKDKTPLSRRSGAKADSMSGGGGMDGMDY